MQTANCKLRTANRKPQTANSELRRKTLECGYFSGCGCFGDEIYFGPFGEEMRYDQKMSIIHGSGVMDIWMRGQGGEFAGESVKLTW